MKTLRLPLVGDTGLGLYPLFLLLVLPLLASLFLGYMFREHQISHVPTALLDEDNTALSRSLGRYIATNDAFDVRFRPLDQQSLQLRLAHSDAALGLVIPANFSKDLSEGKAPKVLVIYDGTQLSITSVAKSRIAEVLGTIKAGFMLKVMEGKLGVAPAGAPAALSPMGSVTRLIGNPTKSTSNSTLEGILFNIAQIALTMVGVELVRNTRRLKFYCLKTGIAVVFGSISLALILLSQSLIFGVPFRCSVFPVALLSVLFSSTMIALGSTLVLAIGVREVAISVCGFLSVTFILSGYTFPVFAMPDFLHGVEFFLPYTHYGNIIRRLVLIGDPVIRIAPDVLWLLAVSAILILLNGFLLKRAQKMKEAIE